MNIDVFYLCIFILQHVDVRLNKSITQADSSLLRQTLHICDCFWWIIMEYCLVRYLSIAIAANVFTDAHTDIPCRYGTALHMNEPNRQPVEENNTNCEIY